MSLEGLWRVQFHSSALPGGQAAGAGVVVFQAGRIIGGDSWMYYEGAFSENGDNLSGTLHIGTHTQGGQSVFGPIKEFNLKISGTVRGNNISATGEVVEQPGMQLQATLERIR